MGSGWRWAGRSHCWSSARSAPSTALRRGLGRGSARLGDLDGGRGDRVGRARRRRPPAPRFRWATGVSAGRARHHERGDHGDGSVCDVAVSSVRSCADRRPDAGFVVPRGGTRARRCHRLGHRHAGGNGDASVTRFAGGFPTVTHVKAALGDLGVEVDQLAPTAMRREGVAVMSGSDRRGGLEVRVYGRDAWEGELLADLWRLAWYRGRRRSARLSRAEYVEHEGFITMLAARGGVAVPEVITAGLAGKRRRTDRGPAERHTLATARAELSADEVQELWDQLGRLHACGIVHHRIDLDRVVVADGHPAGFGDLSSASVLSDQVDAVADRARLFALTVATSGRGVAIGQAKSAIGRDGFVAVLPYLQEASLPPFVRATLHSRHIDLDTVRSELAEPLGVEDIELVKVRRVTWKSFLNLALLAIAAYTIIVLRCSICWLFNTALIPPFPPRPPSPPSMSPEGLGIVGRPVNSPVDVRIPSSPHSASPPSASPPSALWSLSLFICCAAKFMLGP